MGCRCPRANRLHPSSLDLSLPRPPPSPPLLHFRASSRLLTPHPVRTLARGPAGRQRREPAGPAATEEEVPTADSRAAGHQAAPGGPAGPQPRAGEEAEEVGGSPAPDTQDFLGASPSREGRRKEGLDLAAWSFGLEWEQASLMTSEEPSGPVPTEGLFRPRLSDAFPAACSRHPAWAQQGRSSHQAPCRKHPRPSLPLAPTQLPTSHSPQPHRHTLLTNVVELPCHFHLIMVMTQRRGAALTGSDPI